MIYLAITRSESLLSKNSPKIMKFWDVIESTERNIFPKKSGRYLHRYSKSAISLNFTGFSKVTAVSRLIQTSMHVSISKVLLSGKNYIDYDLKYFSNYNFTSLKIETLWSFSTKIVKNYRFFAFKTYGLA